MVLQLKKWTLDLPINRIAALVVAVVLIFCVFGEVVGDDGASNWPSDLEEVSHFPHVTVNLTAEKGYNNHGSFDTHKKIPVQDAGPQAQGKIEVDAIGHINISDIIKNGELSTIFCERCTFSQKQKVEQILYLLSNFNNNNGVPTSSKDSTQKEYILRKNKRDKNKQFKRKYSTTNSPVLQHWKNLPEMIPTPEILSSSHHPRNPNPNSQVIQLPNFSSTTPTTSSSTYSSMAIPIVPYFYSASSPTSPLPSSVATTLSSALEPSQSVEMPTPPMPPTTTGPIYLYYLGSQSSLSSSGSLEPPTTPVVESSLAAFASSNPSTRN